MSSKVAALYIRVSTEDQTELSPDAQKRLLLDYAQKNDMIVSGDFIFTESVSGRHAQKRPEFLSVELHFLTLAIISVLISSAGNMQKDFIRLP